MHFVDISIIIAFLVATLYIGFSSGKKIKTFGDYAIGNRKFSDFAIFCTVAATIIGGSATIGDVGMFHKVGVVHVLSIVSYIISILFTGIFMARWFSLYYGCYSLGDMFYIAYGPTGKIFAGFLGWFFEMLLISLQFTALGTAINVLTGLSYQISLFISAGIILIYTGRGGVRAVTFTDVLQFIVLIVAFPILLMSVLGDIGGFHALMERLPKAHLTMMNEHFSRYFFLSLFYIIPALGPQDIQRLLMMKNGNQGVKAFQNVTWIYLFLTIIILLLGLAAKVLLPELEQGDEALLVLFTQYLPTGLFGIAVIGILAVLMSTADSGLNTGSIMLINDVIIPFCKYIKKKDLSEAEKLKYAHIISIVMGLGAIIFASLRVAIFELDVFIVSFWYSIVLAPLYFLIFNRKLQFKHFVLSVIISVSTFIFWEIFMKHITNIDSIFPGFFISFVTVLFFYLLGGRQKVFSDEELERKRLLEEVQTKKRPNVRELQVRNNIVLGLCLLCLQLIPLAFDLTALTYPKLLLVLANGTMAILLIFGGSLEIFANRKRFQWLKLITLFFCLPVTSLYLLLTSPENGLHILTLLLSFVVMSLSIEAKNKRKMLVTCCLTVLVAIVLFQKNHCTLCWPETFAWQHSFYLFGYLAVLFLLQSTLAMLKKEKQLVAYYERYLMARSLSHDLTTPLVALRILIDQKKDSFAPKEYRLLKNINSEMGSYVEHFIVSNLKDGIRLKPENLNECLISCTEKQKILSRQRFDVQLQASGTVFARVDAVLFRRIINNLLKICTHALPQGCNTVIVSLEETPQGKAKVLLQAAQGHFSAKLIQSMFIEDQKLGDEIDLGISFREFQDIVTKWHSKLEMITHDDDAFFQMIIPCAKQ